MAQVSYTSPLTQQPLLGSGAYQNVLTRFAQPGAGRYPLSQVPGVPIGAAAGAQLGQQLGQQLGAANQMGRVAFERNYAPAATNLYNQQAADQLSLANRAYQYGVGQQQQRLNQAGQLFNFGLGSLGLFGGLDSLDGSGSGGWGMP